VTALAWQKSSYSGEAANCVNLAATTDGWQKSSHSPEGGNCVNLMAADHTLRLRESDTPDVVLTTTPTALAAFLASIKARPDAG
jgi:hypothetical protein